MKKAFSFLLFVLILLNALLITGSALAESLSDPVTLENGVTKLAKNLYTLTITGEYDLHCMDGYFRNRYWDEEYAEYYQAIMRATGGACSGARNGNYVGRNYDWYYADYPCVVVKTTATDTRLASLSCFTSCYNTKTIETQPVDFMYSLVAADGINEAGVAIQINVVQKGYELTDGTNPEGQDTMALLVCRMVLDQARSVEEAVELICQANLYCAYSDSLCYEFHWMISDLNHSVVVEVVDHQIVVTEANVFTNFYVNSQYFDGTVESLCTHQPMAMGWRRYFLVKEGLEEVHSVENMYHQMSKVFYWKAYDPDIENYWYDEAYGVYDLDGDHINETTFDINYDLTHDLEQDPFCTKFRKFYCALGHMKTLGIGTWFTEHTTLFDLEKKEMTVVVDEQSYDTHVTFGFDFE